MADCKGAEIFWLVGHISKLLRLPDSWHISFTPALALCFPVKNPHSLSGLGNEMNTFLIYVCRMYIQYIHIIYYYIHYIYIVYTYIYIYIIYIYIIYTCIYIYVYDDTYVYGNRSSGSSWNSAFRQVTGCLHLLQSLVLELVGQLGGCASLVEISQRDSGAQYLLLEVWTAVIQMHTYHIVHQCQINYQWSGNKIDRTW